MSCGDVEVSGVLTKIWVGVPRPSTRWLYSHDTLSSVVLQYPSRAFWPHRQITLFVENLRSTEREEWLEAVLGKAISVKTLVIRWRFIGGNRRTIAGLVWQVNGIARAS